MTRVLLMIIGLAVAIGAFFVLQPPEQVVEVDQENDASVKLGIVLGFTGPAESLAESMARGAELAIKEVSASKLLLDSAAVSHVRADSTCVDASAAAAAGSACSVWRWWLIAASVISSWSNVISSSSCLMRRSLAVSHNVTNGCRVRPIVTGLTR